MYDKYEPSVGEVLQHRTGSLWLVLDCLGQYDALVQNMSTGWTCVAHGIHREQDDRIWWNYSTCGRFEEIREEVI